MIQEDCIKRLVRMNNQVTNKPSREEAEEAVRILLKYAGEDPAREGLLDTPKRVVKSYDEFYKGYNENPHEYLSRTFEEVSGYDEMVVLKNIEFFSTCEHHMLPFFGKAHIAYIPNGKITGLSKIARLVDVFAKRPQVQERMTSQIADAMMEILKPMGVIVIIDCEHLCMSMRGVRKSEARTITSAVRGVLRDPATRAEAMSLITAR